MGGVPLLLAIATLGVDYGWQPTEAGGVEYIVQIPPDQLEQLQRLGGDISSTVDPEIRGRIERVVIRVGEGDLPHDAGTPPAADQVAEAATGSDADRAPIPIPSLEQATDRLAMNTPAAETSASVMRPAGDDPTAGSDRYQPSSGPSGFGFPAPGVTAAQRGGTSEAGSGSQASDSPDSASIPPFTGAAPPRGAGSASSPSRDDRWADAAALRSAPPSTDPRPAPSTDPISRTDPRTNDPRSNDPRSNDPRTDPRAAAPATTSDARITATPWAAPQGSGSAADSTATATGRSTPSSAGALAGAPTASAGPAASPTTQQPSPGMSAGTQGGSAAGGGFGNSGFGVPPVGYAGDASQRGDASSYPYANNGYGNIASGGGTNYAGAPAAASNPMSPQGPAYAPNGYVNNNQPDYYRGWDANAGVYRTTGGAEATPPLQQPPYYDGRSPATYGGAPYYATGQTGNAAQPPLGIPTPAPPTTHVAASPTPAPAPVTTAAPSPSDAAAPRASASDSHGSTAGAAAGRSLIERGAVSDDRVFSEPRSLAFQPVFNGMLLLSLVANAYLLITLSRLLQRYRNIVANVRTTAPHPTATA